MPLMQYVIISILIYNHICHICDIVFSLFMTFALTMGNVNNKLSEKYSWQQDGAFLKQEEMRITNYAKTYAYCEHSLVVVSNLRTSKSHIFVGMTGEMLGIGTSRRLPMHRLLLGGGNLCLRTS